MMYLSFNHFINTHSNRIGLFWVWSHLFLSAKLYNFKSSTLTLTSSHCNLKFFLCNNWALCWISPEPKVFGYNYFLHLPPHVVGLCFHEKVLSIKAMKHPLFELSENENENENENHLIFKVQIFPLSSVQHLITY